MRIVVALGGNALLPRGMELTMAHQREAVRAASAVLADVAAEHQLVITHGNGPQVGLLAMQAAAYDPATDVTLDVLDAESAGMVGYVIEQEVGNRLPQGRGVVTVLTTTLVDAPRPGLCGIRPSSSGPSTTPSRHAAWSSPAAGSSVRTVPGSAAWCRLRLPSRSSRSSRSASSWTWATW